MRRNPSYHRNGAKTPVGQVRWDDATKFCERLSAQTGEKFQLPTEAQWEYACRGGSTMAFCFGDNEGQLDEYAWYCENSDREPHAVGRKRPNAWGLYDMHGNAWEWCQDWYGHYPSGGVTDPLGPRDGRQRVNRGGGFYDRTRRCRSACRLSDIPYILRGSLGFRPVRPLP